MFPSLISYAFNTLPKSAFLTISKKSSQILANSEAFFLTIYVSFSRAKHADNSFNQRPKEGLHVFFQQSAMDRLACNKHRVTITFSPLERAQLSGNKPNIHSLGFNIIGDEVIWEIRHNTDFQNF